ncbi:MAG TPA: hypothetical protein DCZ94_07540 [Lentisphaeria bacterium]|nr:MAG: hypothetical protein A2X48_14215 [Lentisphaerae bacterium GWF2_49_21]HBC86789.1 hypothetical protein [Lentisphaeria bacterium]
MAMVTISDIARKAGVSPNTVSRVINGNAEYVRPSFSKRAARIRKMADKMGYMPNAAAQSMRSGRHRCISMLAGHVHWGSAFSGDLLIGMQKTLSSLGYNMMLNILPKDEIEAGKELPRIFRENSVDGIFIGIMRSVPEWLESLIADMEIPKVWIGSKKKTDCIHHDDFGAAYDITRKLIGEGHAKIAYMDLSTSAEALDRCHFSVLDKMNGYLKAMKQAGLAPQVIRSPKTLLFDQRSAYARDNLFDKDMPTAVISYDLHFAGRSFLCNAWKKGIEIPGDISLATFAEEESFEDDLKISSFVPNHKFAETAVNLLYDKINNGNKPHKPAILPFDFVEGDTIAGPRRKNE